MVTCHPEGCAGLCCDAGLAAAYDEHHAILVARARQVVVDPHLAEEAAQETFTRAWRSCARFDPRRGPLRQWLLAICVNVARDYVRARVRRPTTRLGDATQPLSTGDGGVEHVLCRAALVEALERLTPEHREALVHTFLLDLPYAEVAERLGVRPSTLRTRVHYALRHLRSELQPAW